MPRFHLALLVAALAAAPAPLCAQGTPGAPPLDGRGTVLPAQEIPRVSAVQVDGLSVHDPVRIAALLGYVVGQPLPDQRRRAAGVERVWDDYGILVPNDSVRVDETAEGVSVSIAVIEPYVDLDPKFVGNVTFDDTKLREWALLDARAEMYVHEAPRVVEQLERAYRRQGFHFVEVEAVIGGEGTRRDQVIFEIREGPKVRVTDVHVRGNENLPDTGFWIWSGGLRSLAKLGTKGRGLFSWFGRRFDQEVLEADLQSMREVYRGLGYLDARVELEKIEFRDDRRRAEVYIMVDEGERYTVSSVAIVGVEAARGADGAWAFTEVPLVISEEELRALLVARPDEPLERARINEDERALRTRYGLAGHLDASFFEFRGDQRQAEAEDAPGWRFHEPEYTYDVEHKTVAIKYRLQQGRPLTVRSIAVEGNEYSRDHIVRREITQLPGERAEFDAILRSVRRIRGLGFFSDPRDPQHPEPEVAFVPVEGSPDEVDLVYRVKDGQTIDANLSGGVASDQGLVGLISLSMRNFDAQNLPSQPWRVFSEVYRKEAFMGDGERLSLDLAPGSEVSYWRALYTHPDIFGSEFDRYSATVELLNRERRFSSHDEERTRERLTIGRNFGVGDFRMSLGVQAQDVTIRNLNQDDVLPSTLVRSVGSTSFVGLTGSLSYDDLDNRQSPQQGWSVNLSNILYLSALGGDEDLWTSELTWDLYRHFDEDELTAAPGIHIGLAGGIAAGFGPGSDIVHYSERYFLGGSQRMRGFRFRGVGPYQGDYAVGGETYVYGTLEYRFPLYATPLPGSARRSEVLRGGLFLDSAIIDREVWEVDAKELRVSAGFQFGLTAPFPITFNFGWPLVSDVQDEKQVFSFRLAFGR
ncbi:MAG: BamA/TamA family outer membrane protein [Planctomycetota bacterium]